MNEYSEIINWKNLHNNSKDFQEKKINAIRVRNFSGMFGFEPYNGIRLGKAIERGVSKLIIIAEDVEPPEVVAHLPIICEEQKAAYVFVPSKQELGKALGIEVTSAAAAILDSGDAQHIIDEVIASIAKIKGGKSEPTAKPEATEPAAKPAQ